MVEGREGVELTSDGLHEGGGAARQPQTTEEILETWRRALRAGERRMLDVLVEARPERITREELGIRSGFTSSGGTFGTYLGSLRRNGLAVVDGDRVGVSETLFLGVNLRALARVGDPGISGMLRPRPLMDRALRRLVWGAACVALMVGLSASTANATEPSAADRETSRDLYASGIKSLASGDFNHAESACGGAFKLVSAPTGAVCWARALEGLGKLVEARDAYLSAMHYPLRPDEPRVFAEAREAGRVGAEHLVARIATITIGVSGVSDDARLRVAIDGVEFASDTARLPRKVNPGHHVLFVASEGFRTARVELTVADGEERRVDVQLQQGSADESHGAVANDAPASEHSTLAYVFLGVGAAGLILGGVFTALAIHAKSNANSACSLPGDGCPAGVEPGPYNSAITRNNIGAGIGFGVAAVAGGFGLIWLLSSDHTALSTTSSERAGVAPWLGIGSAGVEGRF